jgi:phosphohistidine phosphatase
MMQLLVIRHAIAEDREEFAASGDSDDARPLTRKGEKRMKQVARGLHEEVESIDRLATSPLKRAVQTAAIVADEYDLGEPEVTDTLVPDASHDDFVRWAGSLGDIDTLAVVGHEPHLSSLVGWLVGGGNGSRIDLKKGGCCLIEFESAPKEGAGTLMWLLTPGQARRLAG